MPRCSTWTYYPETAESHELWISERGKAYRIGNEWRGIVMIHDQPVGQWITAKSAQYVRTRISENWKCRMKTIQRKNDGARMT